MPFDLTLLVMPGCMLYASGEVPIPVFNLGGAATLALPLCQCPALGGSEVHLQSFVLDPLANPRGVSVSNGLTLRLGIR